MSIFKFKKVKRKYVDKHVYYGMELLSIPPGTIIWCPNKSGLSHKLVRTSSDTTPFIILQIGTSKIKDRRVFDIWEEGVAGHVFYNCFEDCSDYDVTEEEIRQLDKKVL